MPEIDQKNTLYNLSSVATEELNKMQNYEDNIFDNCENTVIHTEAISNNTQNLSSTQRVSTNLITIKH